MAAAAMPDDQYYNDEPDGFGGGCYQCGGRVSIPEPPLHGLGFSPPRQPEARTHDGFDFLCFAVMDGDGRGYHAVVNGVHYGPYDEKQEMLDRICLDLSTEATTMMCGYLAVKERL